MPTPPPWCSETQVAPLAVFDDVYAEPHTALAAQRRRFGAYLDGFADDEEDAR